MGNVYIYSPFGYTWDTLYNFSKPSSRIFHLFAMQNPRTLSILGCV